MDILVRTQATAAINIIVPLVINTGAVDTGATLTIKAINPDGSENTTFTTPTVSEVIAGTGVYKLVFAADAANKLFTLADENNPYTVLVCSATAGSTGYRAVRCYCVSSMPGDIATSTELAAVDALIDGAIVTIEAIPTLAEMEASTVLALEATVQALPTLAEMEASTVLALEATVQALPTLAEMEASTVLALEATAQALPTLAEMEASTVLAKEATVALLKKFTKNKKTLTVSEGVYYLVIYDDNDIDEILRKTIKDIAGADITAVASGVIARETKSSV